MSRGSSKASIERYMREQIRREVYGAQNPEEVDPSLARDRILEVISKWEAELVPLKEQLEIYAQKLAKVLDEDLPRLMDSHKDRDFGFWLGNAPNVYHFWSLQRTLVQGDVLETILCFKDKCSRKRRQWRLYCDRHDSSKANGILGRRYVQKANDYMATAIANETKMIEHALKMHCLKLIAEYRPEDWIDATVDRLERRLSILRRDLIKLETSINKDTERFVFDIPTRIRIMRKSSFRCVRCSADLHDIPVHIDHITPLSRGGTNEEGNLQALCGPCNLKKGNRFIG